MGGKGGMYPVPSTESRRQVAIASPKTERVIL